MRVQVLQLTCRFNRVKKRAWIDGNLFVIRVPIVYQILGIVDSETRQIAV
jgi:hypothetical protein